MHEDFQFFFFNSEPKEDMLVNLLVEEKSVGFLHIGHVPLQRVYLVSWAGKIQTSQGNSSTTGFCAMWCLDIYIFKVKFLLKN